MRFRLDSVNENKIVIKSFAIQAFLSSILKQDTDKNKIFKVYPNPSKNKIYIEANEVSDVRLYDLLGEEVFKTKEKSIDVSGLSEGIYFVHVTTTNGIVVKKVIVQH